jgi:hypothetical protein
MTKIMRKNPIIRTIYLYLFATLGLIFLAIGAIRFIDMGLKAFVFTKAEQEQRSMYKQPPMPYALEKIEGIVETEPGKTQLTELELTQVRQWLVEYRSWKENYGQIDPVVSQRHRDSSINLSLMIVGLPLYLYHWSVIKKEVREARMEDEEEQG